MVTSIICTFTIVMLVVVSLEHHHATALLGSLAKEYCNIQPPLMYFMGDVSEGLCILPDLFYFNCILYKCPIDRLSE